jgi:penicillin-binding protein 1C
MAFVQPSDLQRIEICTASGDIPNDACHARSQAWFIAGKSPIRASTLHRTVLIDKRTGKLACKPSPYTRAEIFEYWPSDMAAIFKKAGLPLRQPPSGSCDRDANPQGAPSIVSPLRGVVHLRRLSHGEPIYLRAEAGSNSTSLLWFVDNAMIGTSKPSEALSWNPPQTGNFLIRVVDEQGSSDSRQVAIELTE